MKILLSLFISVFIFNSSVDAQETQEPVNPYKFTDENGENNVWTKVEQEAQFPSGNEGWKSFLIRNLKPEKIADKIIFLDSSKIVTHTVILKFIVSKDGSISDIAVEKSSNDYCSLEAIRVMKLSPKWIPGYQNKRAVNCYRRQPITFAFAK